MSEQSIVAPAPRIAKKGDSDLNVLARLWETLTRPHPNITDIETKRQSRLLSGFMLAILIITLFAVVMLLSAGDRITFLAPAIVITLALYFVNRSGRYLVSAILFIALITMLLYIATMTTHEISWLFFTPVPIFLSAMLMPITVTTWLFAGNVAAQLVLNTVDPQSIVLKNINALFVSAFVSALIFILMRHRSVLEKERQAELQHANDKLRKSEAALEIRVAERTAELEVAKRDAEEARDRALQADRTKSQFLASMSHELRTPMNSILTFTELISMGTFGDVNDEQKDYLLKSLQSGRHLLSLINDVLDVTKIQSGMMRLFVEDDFNVRKEIESVAAAAEKLLSDKSVKLVLDVDNDFASLTCDKRRVRQVLLNLVSNAVKFTDDGVITLSAKKQPDQILFAVMDTGPGIAKDQQDLIFEPFVQTETGVRHAGGTGLGLPISRSLVEAHGGKLWLESAPGEGSSFFFTLPLHSAVGLGEREVA